MPQGAQPRSGHGGGLGGADGGSEGGIEGGHFELEGRRGGESTGEWNVMNVSKGRGDKPQGLREQGESTQGNKECGEEIDP